jgi:glycine oxidase
MKPQHHRNFDLVVVGAGVIGLSIAWRASRSGRSVCVIEADQPAAGASGVAAGMLAPVTEAAFGERNLIALNVESARGYPEFVAELESQTGLHTGYRPCGTVAVAGDRDELEILDRLHRLQRSLDLDSERLTAAEARRLEPTLATRIRGGIHAPGDHQVCPRKLIVALLAASDSQGVELAQGDRVAAIGLDGNPELRLASGSVIESEQVVIAAGLGSARIAGLPRIPLRPVKGQILRLRSSADQAPRRIVRTPEVYIVPRDGEVVIGATVEERGEDRTVTAGGVLELLRCSYAVVPSVLEMELVETAAGLRPTTPDNGPLVGADASGALVWATGHWRNGILQAPVTAAEVLHVLDGSPPSPLFAPFVPVRFTSAVAGAGR